MHFNTLPMEQFAIIAVATVYGFTATLLIPGQQINVIRDSHAVKQDSTGWYLTRPKGATLSAGMVRPSAGPSTY
jgi:hypothetical protein